MRMTPAENNKEIALHKRVRPVHDWHRILCRFGEIPSISAVQSVRFNAAVEQLVQSFQTVEAELGNPEFEVSSVGSDNVFHLESPLTKFAEDSSKHQKLLDLVPDGIISLATNGTLIYSNRAAQNVFQAITESDLPLVTGSSFPVGTVLQNVSDARRLAAWMREVRLGIEQNLRDAQSWKSSSFELPTKDGKIWEVTAQLEYSALDATINIVLHDVSRLEESNVRAKYNSQHDALTGLPNRVGLLEELRARVKSYDSKAASDAIFFFDLDGFKFVNDSLGHQAGDELLCAVARRIEALLSPDQRLYRLGGDEFVVRVEGITNLHEIPRLAEKLGKAFVPPFPIQQKDTYLGASIGIAILNDNTESAEQLIQQADLAMYQAKEAGGHGHSFYNSDVEEEIQRRYAMRADIRAAIKNNEFMVFYQPKYDLRTKKLCGAEALIRWFRDGKFHSSPADFIPEAETCGLIVPISQLVFQQVANDVRSWSGKNFSPIVTSVNISACHFQLGDLMDDLLSSFISQGVAANLIELEITESSFLNDMSRAIEKIRMLQRFGFSVSIDDFGTGYSSLSYLKNLPADVVKIDRSYVAEIETSEFDATLVQSVIRIAHTQGLKVVAEGVETDAGMELLTEYGCDIIQGYWYGKPLPAKEFESQYLSQLNGIATK